MEFSRPVKWYFADSKNCKQMICNENNISMNSIKLVMDWACIKGWSTWCYAGIKWTLVYIFVHVSSMGLYNKVEFDSGKYGSKRDTLLMCCLFDCTTGWTWKLNLWLLWLTGLIRTRKGLLQYAVNGETLRETFFFFFTNLTVLIGNSPLLFIVAYG